MGIRGKHYLVAIVDDDESARTAIHGVLKSARFNVESFVSAEEFLASDHLSHCACLVTDVQMPGMSGLKLQEQLAEGGRSIPVLFVSAYGDEKVRLRAMNAKAIGFLDKPFNDDELIAIVRTAIEG